MVNRLAELQREIERKRAESRARVSVWFTATVRVVGEAEARRQWAEVLKGKPGKPRGTTNADRDARLLVIFDEWLRCHPGRKSRLAAPRLVGKRLDVDFPGEFGLSAGAIATRINRLLKQRKPAPGGSQNALVAAQAELAAGKWPVGWPWDAIK
jgi:hypothetical protein